VADEFGVPLGNRFYTGRAINREKSKPEVDSSPAATQLAASFPMTLNVALIVLIAVVVALVVATTIPSGRLAEAKSS
jgi:hypothetical protein